jgi:hypothetical protein
LATFHDDVPDRVRRSAEDRLEAQRRVGVGEAVLEAADVPLAPVELDPVVVGGEHLIAVEVDGPRAVLLGLHGVAEADELVVANDVAGTLHVDSVVVRVCPTVVGVDGRPLEAPLEQVVAEVIVELVRIGADAEDHVRDVHPPHDVRLGARALEPERAARVCQGEGFDVDEAAVHLEHVARRAAAAVENDVLLRRAADDDGRVGGAARVDAELAGVGALRQRDHVARSRGGESLRERRGVGDALRMRHRGILRHRARRARHRLRRIAAVGVGRGELDLVRRCGLKAEHASGKLRGNGAARDALRPDAKERRTVAPGRRPLHAIADRDGRVVIVVPGDEELHAERDDGGPIEGHRAHVQDVVRAGDRRERRRDEHGSDHQGGSRATEQARVPHPSRMP